MLQNVAAHNVRVPKRKVFKTYTGCEGYCRPFFKMVSCINRLSDHDKIFTVYPLLHLLLSSGVYLLARLKGPRQENQRSHCQNNLRRMREDGE